MPGGRWQGGVKHLHKLGLMTPTAAMVGRAVALGAPGLVHGPDAVLPIYGRAPDATPRAAKPGAATRSGGSA